MFEKSSIKYTWYLSINIVNKSGKNDTLSIFIILTKRYLEMISGIYIINNKKIFNKEK
jgi:hypothetical protein